MPLKKGKSRAAFKYNVEELIQSGREPKQAVAIAYSEQKRAKAAPKRKRVSKKDCGY